MDRVGNDEYGMQSVKAAFRLPFACNGFNICRALRFPEVSQGPCKRERDPNCTLSPPPIPVKDSWGKKMSSGE